MTKRLAGWVVFVVAFTMSLLRQVVFAPGRALEYAQLRHHILHCDNCYKQYMAVVAARKAEAEAEAEE